MLMRFLGGCVISALLAFIPYSAISAVYIWVFGRYDPKFGATDAWLLSNQIAALIMISVIVGFSVAFPLLNRPSVYRGFGRFLVMSAVPVLLVYAMAFVGLDVLAFRFFETQSLSVIMLAFAAIYLLGALCVVGVSLCFRNSKNGKLRSQSS